MLFSRLPQLYNAHGHLFSTHPLKKVGLRRTMINEQTAINQTRADDEKLVWQDTILFIVVHVLAAYTILFYFEWQWVLLAIGSYYLRMFALSAGFHRYFSHRSYKTSRVFAFILAFIGECSFQRGVLWWASHHRHHHRYSDQPEDVHSPIRKGFWWSHMGWILCDKYKPMNEPLIKDFLVHPELVWLNKNTWLPVNSYMALLLLLFGLEGFLWGFIVSTVFLWHGTFSINSLVHVWGTQPFATNDNSRNNIIGAIFTMGDGWHNNHHYYPISVRHGFRWWQIDPSFYLLSILERIGVVWDMKMPRIDSQYMTASS